MVFVDGENVAIRYGSMLGDAEPLPHVSYEKDVYVWSDLLNVEHRAVNTVRQFYYTCAKGDEDTLNKLHDKLQSIGLQTPKVFKKTKGRSKRVDIALCVDMLTHANAKNYDAAVLVAGDEDYVPLVEAVKSQGPQVFLWFLKNGLSEKLRRSADYFFKLEEILLDEGIRSNLHK